MIEICELKKDYFSAMRNIKEPYNYQQSLLVDIDKKSVFRALTNEISNWWSTVAGTYDKVGDQFRVSFGAESFWLLKVKSLDEPNKVVWECIESHQDHNLKGIDEEWINTLLYWTITEAKGITKIDFLHDGLLSNGVCYEVCSKGWDFYILESLKNYLENGKGKPSEK
jgi:hypothetical protein